MGIETAALVVAAVSAAATVYSTQQQASAARKSSRAQKEAADISAAQQSTEQAEQRRQQIRQERIKRGQIAQASANTGVSGSSGELGSTSALGTNMGNNLAISSGRVNTANAISSQNQRAADASVQSANAGAIGGIAQAGMSLGIQAGAIQGAQNLFGSSSTASQQVDTLINTNPNLFG